MLHFKFVITIAVCTLLSFISFGVRADEATATTIIEKRVVISPAPKAVCTSVPAHWEGNVWVETHNVCRYENRAEGVAWIESYWSCTAADANGNCTAWELVPGHWVKTLD